MTFIRILFKTRVPPALLKASIISRVLLTATNIGPSINLASGICRHYSLFRSKTTIGCKIRDPTCLVQHIQAQVRYTWPSYCMVKPWFYKAPFDELQIQYGNVIFVGFVRIHQVLRRTVKSILCVKTFSRCR